MTSDDGTTAAIQPRNGRRTIVAAVALAAMVAVGIIAPTAAHADEAVGVIADSAVPETLAAPDKSRIEVGLKFSPTTAGTLSGVQFYQNAANSGVSSASVWSSTGARLATVSVSPWAPVGWRTIPVSVQLDAGATYTVSVYDANSAFPATSNEYAEAKTTNGIYTPENAGVYRYGNTSAFPSGSAGGYSLLVDVVFTSETVAPTPDPTPSVAPDPGPAPEPEPAPAPEPEPAPAPDPAPTSDPIGISPPVAATTYGPDGTHWPSDTPRADAARVVDVAASWTAISAAIKANAGSADSVVVCVAPGTISGGNGATSSAKGVLQGIGDASRASRILVAACDGIGTVKVASGPGVAFVGVDGVSIIGIDFSAQPVMVRNSESFAIGYSKVPRLLVTANGGNGVQDLEIVEIVAGPEAVHGVSYDRVEVKSAKGYDVDGVRFAGFYAAPNYKPNGSSGHCDTIQFVTTSGDGTITNVTIEDSVVFQSADQGIMAGSNAGGAISNSAFFGGTVGQLRYPMYPGGDPITLSNLLHGAWSGLSVSDTIVAGSIHASYTFASVVDSASTAGMNGFDTLGQLTLDDIDRLAPMPTTARLESIWN